MKCGRSPWRHIKWLTGDYWAVDFHVVRLSPHGKAFRTVTTLWFQVAKSLHYSISQILLLDIFHIHWNRSIMCPAVQQNITCASISLARSSFCWVMAAWSSTAAWEWRAQSSLISLVSLPIATIKSFSLLSKYSLRSASGKAGKRVRGISLNINRLSVKGSNSQRSHFNTLLRYLCISSGKARMNLHTQTWHPLRLIKTDARCSTQTHHKAKLLVSMRRMAQSWRRFRDFRALGSYPLREEL